MNIPGVSHGTLLILLSELGPGFISKFATPSKFCRWCNLTPVDKVTGGELKSSNIPKRKNPVGQALRQCAISLQNKDVPLGHYYRRMRARLGGAQAVVATAHKIAEIIYLMVSRQEEYRQDVTAQSEKNLLHQKIANLEARRKHLENQINKLDSTLAPQK